MAERLADFTNMPNRPEESPSKPPGILMTPGTARTRKTVSFGGGVKDATELRKDSKSGIPDDCPGKFPSPWVPKEPSKLGDGNLRRTALTRSLEKVRDTRRKVTEEREGKSRFPSIPDTPIPEKTEDNDGRPRSRRGPEPDTPMTICDIDVETRLTTKQLLDEGKEAEAKRKDRVRQLIKEATEPETTIDFNEPRSKSGRYWKAEYETYHEDAKAQMKKLVRYKQLAKDYAKKKDEENIDLKEKLEEEQARVVAMEEKIAELAGRLNGDEDSPALMKVLARQTELAVKYKNEVDKFRIAMENRESERKERGNSSDEDDGGLSVETKHGNRAMSRLHHDMEIMRLSLAAAEERAKTLEQENAKLSRDLVRTKEDLLQSEKRREAADERNSDTLKLLEELQKNYNNLKEAAKSQRRDAEHLLKRRHDQVVELKKEIKSLKRASRHQDEEPVRERSSSRNKQELELDERGIKRRSASAHPSLEVADVVVEASIRPAVRTRASSERRRATENTPSLDTVKEDRVRRTSQLAEDAVKPRRSRVSLNDYLFDARKDRVSQKASALAEISNTKIATARSISPAKRHTPHDLSLRQRFTTLSNKAPQIRDGSPEKTGSGYESPLKPDSETAESTQQVRISSNTATVGASDKRQPSPRPSRYNFAQDDTPTPRALRYEYTEGGRGRADDSRLQSMASTRSRTDLDPERAAAAKARLEHRNAERRRTRESSARQENVRIPA